MLLMHGYATFNMVVPGPQICCRYEMCTARPKNELVYGNYVRETSVKRQKKIVQEITRNVANFFSFYAIIAIEHGFSMHSPGPLGGVEYRSLRPQIQHLLRDLANVNA